MSNAQIWAALQQSAMVGADRLPVPQALVQAAAMGTDPCHQALLAAIVQPAESAAAQLLRASAVAAVFERAGWQPGSQITLKAPLAEPQPAPAERRPAPEDEALKSLMREVLADGPFSLRAAMLRILDQSGLRLPHDLLALALEQGRQATSLRPWLDPVLGERGRWLGTLNPQWSYAGGVEETASPEQLWQEGSVDQRVALLRSERQTDAAGARERLEASLKNLGAKERLLMVQTLAVGLSLEDEPLLEKLLRDRSREVREHAAQLLSCLPGSAHSQRVAGWMRAMLRQDEQGQWSIEPPEQAPEDWAHDGVVSQPSPYFRGGQKAWLLQQVVQLTPLGFWTQTLGKTPVQLMQWVRQSDWKASLRQGLQHALNHQLDVEWIEVAQGREMRSDTLVQLLMAKLPPAEREARWQAWFERDQGKLVDTIAGIAQSMPDTEYLSPALSERLVDALHQALGGRHATQSWHSWQADQALLSCARMLDVASLQRFAALWRQPALQADTQDEAAPADVPATPADPASALTPEQQAMLDRSRIRPWDDDRVRDGLERIVRLRLGLHQAFAVQRAA